MIHSKIQMTPKASHLTKRCLGPTVLFQLYTIQPLYHRKKTPSTKQSDPVKIVSILQKKDQLPCPVNSQSCYRFGSTSGRSFKDQLQKHFSLRIISEPFHLFPYERSFSLDRRSPLTYKRLTLFQSQPSIITMHCVELPLLLFDKLQLLPESSSTGTSRMSPSKPK